MSNDYLLNGLAIAGIAFALFSAICFGFFVFLTVSR